MHTANAATVREHEVLMNLSAWLIEAQAFVIVKPTTDFRKEQQMGKVICIANQKAVSARRPHVSTLALLLLWPERESA